MSPDIETHPCLVEVDRIIAWGFRGAIYEEATNLSLIAGISGQAAVRTVIEADAYALARALARNT